MHMPRRTSGITTGRTFALRALSHQYRTKRELVNGHNSLGI